MKIQDYQEAATRTLSHECRDLSNMGLGLSGEASELADLFSVHFFRISFFDKDRVKKEIGDIMWYISGTCTILDFSFQEAFTEAQTLAGEKYPLITSKDVYISELFSLIRQTGSLSDEIKKYEFQGHELRLNYAKNKLVQIVFCLLNLCNWLRFDVEEILQINIDKLRARYPEGFDPEMSRNRVEDNEEEHF